MWLISLILTQNARKILCVPSINMQLLDLSQLSLYVSGLYQQPDLIGRAYDINYRSNDAEYTTAPAQESWLWQLDWTSLWSQWLTAASLWGGSPSRSEFQQCCQSSKTGHGYLATGQDLQSAGLLERDKILRSPIHEETMKGTIENLRICHRIQQDSSKSTFWPHQWLSYRAQMGQGRQQRHCTAAYTSPRLQMWWSMVWRPFHWQWPQLAWTCQALLICCRCPSPDKLQSMKHVLNAPSRIEETTADTHLQMQCIIVKIRFNHIPARPGISPLFILLLASVFFL